LFVIRVRIEPGIGTLAKSKTQTESGTPGFLFPAWSGYWEISLPGEPTFSLITPEPMQTPKRCVKKNEF
jgi:hypothetical protein